ncbi:hypothetical protein J1614_009832, partial [Plenodomus biglobosus]
ASCPVSRDDPTCLEYTKAYQDEAVPPAHEASSATYAQPWSGNNEQVKHLISLYIPPWYVIIGTVFINFLLKLSMASFPVSSRGGFAPRRGRGGWNRPSTNKREPVKLDTDKHPLGELLKTVYASDLKPDSFSRGASIDDCQYVASYNWLSGAEATVIFPGRPPRWTPLQIPQRLKEDSGQYFRDPNAAKCPEYPMAP